MGDAARFDQRYLDRTVKITLASVFMGACLFGASILMESWLYAPTIRYFALAALLLIAAVSYFGSGVLIGAFTRSDLRAAFKRS